TPETPPVAGVTPVAEFEVTVISAEVPANVRQAPTTESGLVGVIPLGIKATVIGEVVGDEAFAGSGIHTWYLVKAIPPDLPEDGFVYSSVVVFQRRGSRRRRAAVVPAQGQETPGRAVVGDVLRPTSNLSIG
ncbi:MAG: SH3 domain-containing protein, partial [Dehalococcoidia bacterium]